MLKFFEPVFYLKPAQGGFIYRRYPEEWQQVLTYYDFRQQLRTVRRDGRTEKKEVLRKVVATTRERPTYNDVVSALKKESARMGREAREAQEEEERVEAAEREASRRR